MMYSFLRRIKLYKSISEKKIIQIHLHLYTLLLFFFPFNLLTFDPTLQWSRSKARTYMYVARGKCSSRWFERHTMYSFSLYMHSCINNKVKDTKVSIEYWTNGQGQNRGGGMQSDLPLCLWFQFFFNAKKLFCVIEPRQKLKLGAGQGHREWLQCPRIYHPCMVDLNMSDKPTVTWLR